MDREHLRLRRLVAAELTPRRDVRHRGASTSPSQGLVLDRRVHTARDAAASAETNVMPSLFDPRAHHDPAGMVLNVDRRDGGLNRPIMTIGQHDDGRTTASSRVLMSKNPERA
jgi:hypothetical protein